MRNRSLHHHSVMSASHCPGIFCKNLDEWQTNGMWSVYIALPMTQWFTRSTTTNHFCSPTVFTEGRGPQTGTICQAHAVYETQTTLPADLSGLGLTASDQSAAVLLLLCWTWGVSEQTMLVCIHVCVCEWEGMREGERSMVEHGQHVLYLPLTCHLVDYFLIPCSDVDAMCQTAWEGFVRVCFVFET